MAPGANILRKLVFAALLVILVALVFEFINGFHDTANSVAAVVGTRVLTPAHAISLAAVTNLCGALAGTAVATTIGTGLVDAQCVTGVTLCCPAWQRGLEPDHLAPRFAFQLKPRLDRRPGWRGRGFDRQ